VDWAVVVPVISFFAVGAAGFAVGWQVGATISPAVPTAAVVIGTALILVGLTEYRDDGDSGPLVLLIPLGLLGMPIAVTALAGLALGGRLRRTRHHD
jgi:hypothetical protein